MQIVSTDITNLLQLDNEMSKESRVIRGIEGGRYLLTAVPGTTLGVCAHSNPWNMERQIFFQFFYCLSNRINSCFFVAQLK